MAVDVQGSKIEVRRWAEIPIQLYAALEKEDLLIQQRHVGGTSYAKLSA